MTVYWCFNDRDCWVGDWVRADSSAEAAEKYVAEHEYGGTIPDAHEYGPVSVDDDISIRRYAVVSQVQISFHAEELVKHD